VEVLRERGREIFRQELGEDVLSLFEAMNRRNTGSIPRFGNEDLAEKIRQVGGLTLTTDSWTVPTLSADLFRPGLSAAFGPEPRSFA
jgi:hypothetical protein